MPHLDEWYEGEERINVDEELYVSYDGRVVAIDYPDIDLYQFHPFSSSLCRTASSSSLTTYNFSSIAIIPGTSTVAYTTYDFFGLTPLPYTTYDFDNCFFVYDIKEGTELPVDVGFKVDRIQCSRKHFLIHGREKISGCDVAKKLLCSWNGAELEALREVDSMAYAVLSATGVLAHFPRADRIEIIDCNRIHSGQNDQSIATDDNTIKVSIFPFSFFVTGVMIQLNLNNKCLLYTK